MNTTTVEEWIERVSNTLTVQKDLGADTVSMNFTRVELVALKTILNYAKEKKDNETV